MVDIITAFEDEKVFGSSMREQKTWSMWKVFLKTVFGLGDQITGEEFQLFKRFTGRDEKPMQQYEEIYCISGRQSGKTWICSLCCVYLAALTDFWSDKLSPGEKVILPLIAVDQKQAQQSLNYVKGILHSSPILEKRIINELTWEIELRNSVIIRVSAANWRTATRGARYIGLLLDEAAFMKDQSHEYNAEAIISSVKPALLPGGLIMAISSAHGRFGLMYSNWQESWGKEDPRVLIWRSDTSSMNPTYDKRKIERELKKDEVNAKAEYFSEWRDITGTAFPEEVIEKCIFPGRENIEPKEDTRYICFVDHASGVAGGDSFCFCIAHQDYEGEKIKFDYLGEFEPPFQPSHAIEECVNVCEDYEISHVTSDKFAKGFIAEGFEAYGFVWEPCPLSKSELYGQLLVLMNEGRVEIPDDERLLSQMRNLERTARMGGLPDSIDHPRGKNFHDDRINSLAGAAYLASERYERPEIIVLG